MVLKKRTIIEEEEPAEAGLECKYCGGKLEKKNGFYYCANCSKITRDSVLFFDEKKVPRVTPDEVKRFSQKLRELSFTELLDFCCRLYKAQLKKRSKSYVPQVEYAFYSRDEKQGEAVIEPAVSLGIGLRKEDEEGSEAGESKAVEGGEDEMSLSDLIYCSQTGVVNDGKLRELVKIARDEKCARVVVCAPNGFEENAIAYAKGFSEFTLWDAEGLTAAGKTLNVGIKGLRPEITQETLSRGFLEIKGDQLLISPEAIIGTKSKRKYATIGLVIGALVLIYLFATMMPWSSETGIFMTMVLLLGGYGSYRVYLWLKERGS